MGMQQQVEKMQLRQGFQNLWHTDLMGTVTADTPCKWSYLIIGRWLVFFCLVSENMRENKKMKGKQRSLFRENVM